MTPVQTLVRSRVAIAVGQVCVGAVGVVGVTLATLHHAATRLAAARNGSMREGSMRNGSTRHPALLARSARALWCEWAETIRWANRLSRNQFGCRVNGVVARALGDHDVDLMLLLGQASHALTTELAAGLATLGITPRGHCVLYHAAQAELTQSQLAALCALDKTTMVFTIDELEQAGLAERRLSNTDRRARIIGVTTAGRSVVDHAQEIVSGIYEDVLGSLPEAERSAFVQALDRLVTGRLAQAVECERAPRRPRAPRGQLAR